MARDLRVLFWRNISGSCVWSGRKSSVKTSFFGCMLPIPKRESVQDASRSYFSLQGSVILAITDDNSSIVYYEASGSLCPPNPTDTVELKQAKNRRIFERKRASMLQLREEAKRRKTETVDSSKAGV